MKNESLGRGKTSNGMSSRPQPITKACSPEFVAPSKVRPGCPFCEEGVYDVSQKATPEWLHERIAAGTTYVHGNAGADIVGSEVTAAILSMLRCQITPDRFTDHEIGYLLGLGDGLDTTGGRQVRVKGAKLFRPHSLRSLRRGFVIWRRYVRQPFSLTKKETRLIEYSLRLLGWGREEFRVWVGLWNPCLEHILKFSSTWKTWNSTGYGHPTAERIRAKNELLANLKSANQGATQDHTSGEAGESALPQLAKDMVDALDANVGQVLGRIRSRKRKTLTKKEKELLKALEDSLKEKLKTSPKNSPRRSLRPR
jgi:hypothetical protein